MEGLHTTKNTASGSLSSQDKLKNIRTAWKKTQHSSLFVVEKSATKENS